MKLNKTVLICIFLALFLVATVHAAKESVVVVNSRNWRSIYLGTMYAGKINAEILHFNNLYDAEIKTDLIRNYKKKYIFESTSNPVVKGYDQYVETNGLQDYEFETFEDYTDFQEILNDKVGGAKKFVVLDSKFGVEAIAASPLIVTGEYMPVFYDKDNKDEAIKLFKGKKNIIAGRFPIRLAKELDGEKYVGTPQDNANKLTESYILSGNFDWGILERADEVDLHTLKQKLPVFVYAGESSGISKLIAQSGITRFEVIGTSSQPIAQAIEGESGKDLKFMLKYARRVSGAGLGDTMQDLDTVYFDFPFARLEYIENELFERMNILAVTYKNTGNVPVLFITNIEYQDTALADENFHIAYPNQEITIPYPYNVSAPRPGEQKTTFTLNTRYDESLPLSKAIENNEGVPLLILEPEKSNGLDESKIEIIDAQYDNKLGKLYVTVKNPNKHAIKSFAEILLGEEDILASPTDTIESGEKGVLAIETPYHEGDQVLGESRSVQLYFGEQKTIQRESFTIEITSKSGIFSITGAVIGEFATSTAGIVSMIVILVLLIVGIIIRNRRNNYL